MKQQKWFRTKKALPIVGVALLTFAVSAADPNSSSSSSSTDRATRRHNRNLDTSATTTTSSTTSSQSFGSIERANKVIGKEVMGSDNQKLGKIDNIVVDLDTGRVLYTIVSSGGVVGVGATKIAISPGQFTQVKGNNLQVSIDKQKFNGAPKFTSNLDQQSELSKADFVSQVYQYFGETPWWQSANAASQGQFLRVYKSSDLIGMKVVDVQDQTLGKVDNLALDLSAGRVAYVILSPDSSTGLGNNLYALPPNEFSANTKDQKALTTDVNKDKLAAAPHFAQSEWSKVSDQSYASQVYQYYGKQPWFSSSTGSSLQPTGRQ